MPAKLKLQASAEQAAQTLRAVESLLQELEESPAPAVNEMTDTLRSRREALQLSSETACFCCQIAHSSLRNYEAGRTVPQFAPDVQMRLLRAYRITYDQFASLVENTRAQAQANGVQDRWEARKAYQREVRASDREQVAAGPA